MQEGMIKEGNDCESSKQQKNKGKGWMEGDGRGNSEKKKKTTAIIIIINWVSKRKKKRGILG